MKIISKFLLVIWRIWFYFLTSIPVILLSPIWLVSLFVPNGYSFIFCARRDIREQTLSNLVSKNTHIMHIGFEDQTVDVPTFDIKRKHYDYYVQALKDTNRLFEHYRQRGQIQNVIHYEDWQHDVNQILPLLGFEPQSVHTYKKIKYTQGHQSNLVNNLEQVYEWMADDDIFDYKYTL